MKRIALILILCFACSAAGLAETSSADEFLSNLSKTWDSFLVMTQDAGESVSDWMSDVGITEWAEGAAQDISAWAKEAGLTDWAGQALEDITSWYQQTGITEWAQGAAEQVQAFVDENGPAIEAWLKGAGEDVRDAWNTLVHPEGRTEDEVQAAYETVVESLEAAGE